MLGSVTRCICSQAFHGGLETQLEVSLCRGRDGTARLSSRGCGAQRSILTGQCWGLVWGHFPVCRVPRLLLQLKAFSDNNQLVQI